jgi:hypothetical protein
MWSCLRQVVRGHARTPLPVVPALPLPVRPVWVWSRLFASTGDPYGPTPASPTQRYRELSPYTGGSERAARRAHTYRWAKPVKNVLLVKQAGDENATEWAWYSQWGQGGYGPGAAYISIFVRYFRPVVLRKYGCVLCLTCVTCHSRLIGHLKSQHDINVFIEPSATLDLPAVPSYVSLRRHPTESDVVPPEWVCPTNRWWCAQHSPYGQCSWVGCQCEGVCLTTCLPSVCARVCDDGHSSHGPQARMDMETRFRNSWQKHIDLAISIGGDGTMLHMCTLLAHGPFFVQSSHLVVDQLCGVLVVYACVDHRFSVSLDCTPHCVVFLWQPQLLIPAPSFSASTGKNVTSSRTHPF